MTSRGSRGPLVTSADLPLTVRLAGSEVVPLGEPDSATSLPVRVLALGRAAIEDALRAEEGHQSRAAARLGISERALRYKLAKLRGRAEKRQDSSNPEEDSTLVS